MDLAQVKSAVKVWEKAFKAKHKREPTKDDIKKDPSGIAEQYALYRKLSKAGSSQAPSSSASTTTSHSTSLGAGTGGQGSTTQRTPRIIPNAEYPTTPTPSARRSYVQRPNGNASAARTSLPSVLGSEAEAGPSQPRGGRNLKRTASKADLEPPSPGASTSLGTFLTPRKPKPSETPAYAGPVLDPNPLNPFLASPSRARISPFAPKASSSSTPYTMEPSNGHANGSSPFIHASSPRKLKEVLEANSLRKVRARMESAGGSPLKVKEAITPRTRARKRLRGEAVDDTPGKPAQGVRRKRGQRDEVVVTEKGKGKEAMMQEDQADEEDEAMEDVPEEDEEDEDDGMGPSPLRPTAGRVFTAFSDEVDTKKPATGRTSSNQSLKERLSAASKIGVKAKEKGKGKAVVHAGTEDRRQTKMNTFFQRAEKVSKRPAESSRTSGDGQAGSSSTSHPNNTRPPPTSASPPPHTSDPLPEPENSWDSPPPADSDPIDRLPTPPPDTLPNIPSTPPPPPPSLRRRKVQRVIASDDEDDAAASEDREIIIVPTRRAVDARYNRAGSLDSITSLRADDDPAAAEDDPLDHPESEEESPASPSLPPHLMGLLSLRSPTKPLANRHKSELVVKALFDPEAARRLRAMQRGQDVRVGGVDVEDAEQEVDGDGLEGLGEVGGGDDGGGGGGGGVYADDDWEEEDEGWKRPGEDMDDGW